MSDDKTEAATSSSDDKASKAELPDRDVYLRIKPAFEGAHVPYMLNYSDPSFHEIRIQGKGFKCTEIFDQDSSQTEVFDTAIRKRVMDFINGKSSTILTYGGPDTGKKYTLYGTIDEPGIIHHALRLILTTVCCTTRPWYSIDSNDEINALSEDLQFLEVELKHEVLDPFKRHGNVRRRFLKKDNPLGPKYTKVTHLAAVWIAVTSAMNNKFYDVLTGEVYSPEVSFHEDGSAYFPSLEYVYVNTPAEASQLLIGINARRQLGLLPQDRPYIFTIKLLKYQKEDAEDTVTMSTLTFCNVTDEKEFNFDKYVKAVHKDGDRAVFPRSKSKLMMLFKRPLLDLEAITFLVTVDVDCEYGADTMGTLKTLSMLKKY